MTEHSTGTGPAPDVAGSWSLLGWRTVDAAGATIGYPFGEHASGTVFYSPGGAMQGQLAAEHRPQLATSDPIGGSESDRAAAYSSYVAYWGRYRLEPGRIVHVVQSSLFPGWIGGEQVRYATLTDDVLTLRTPPTEVAGTVLVHELRWQRQERW